MGERSSKSTSALVIDHEHDRVSSSTDMYNAERDISHQGH